MRPGDPKISLSTARDGLFDIKCRSGLREMLIFIAGGPLKIRLEGPLIVVAICNTFELLIAKLSLFAIL